uniref:Uncharacterized protein n=1 Tax=Chenopodium quinoa TaxID=63459 RepID=A0A803LGS4_CHEQI
MADIKGSSTAGCNDKCGCPSPCPGAQHQEEIWITRYVHAGSIVGAIRALVARRRRRAQARLPAGVGAAALVQHALLEERMEQ